MKKLFFILPIIMLTACAQDYSKYDSIFEGCERIETTEFHLVYKCPVDEITKQMEPNGQFASGGELNLEELYADTEHSYIEVSLNDPNYCHDQDFTIRTMVAQPVADENWAVIGCYAERLN